MAKNGQSLYVQEMCAPFHGIMHQKKFGGRPMSGRWRRHPPPLSEVVVVEQILLFKGHFDLRIRPICLRKMTKIHEIIKLELKS